MDVRILLGKRIKQLRDRSSMSQKDLAYSSGLDRSYIASVENGTRNISIINIEKIATALNVTLQNFFNINDFNRTSNSNK